MPLILPGNVATATASTTYEVANSCRFNKGDSPSLVRDQSASPTHDDKGTLSFWFKIGNLSSGDGHYFFSVFTDGNNRMQMLLQSDNTLKLIQKVSASTVINLVTNRVFRDVSAWYHLVIACDSSQGTAANRIKIYINGVQETSFSTETYCNQDVDIQLVKGTEVCLGAYNKASPADHFDGYLAEMVLIDGLQLGADSFGEYDEDSPTIWKPKDVSGLTFGTNGFYLDFEDSGDLGDDESGNGNDFTENNLAATDQVTDTPTNNFCTINPLIWVEDQDAVTFSEGNTRSDHDDSNGNQISWGTIMVNAGKWYWEVKVVDVGYTYIGVWQTEGAWTNPGVYDGLSGVTTYRGDDGKTNDENVGTATYGDSYTDGDIISVAVNVDTGTIWFAKNGTWQNSATEAEIEAGTTANSAFTGKAYATNGIVPSITGYSTTEYHVNFGNPPYANSSSNTDENGYGDFEYSVPDGFLALCTKNLGSDGG